VDANGQVLNKLWTVETSVGNVPKCFVEHVANPGFPVVTADLLKTYQASFGGIVNDPYVGYVQSVSQLAIPKHSCRSMYLQYHPKWNFLYGGSIPIIAYLDQENVFVGFDFWGAERRTKVMNRFFNTVVGNVDAKVFEEFPCS